jgi:hypothetical protein
VDDRLYEDADHPLPDDGREHPHYLYNYRGRLRILADGAIRKEFLPAEPNE